MAKKKVFSLVHKDSEYRCQCGEKDEYFHGDVFLYQGGKPCKKCRGLMTLESK